jgi:rhodanese-related sulfurtransferase
MPSPNQITCNQLNRLVGTHTAPVIIDLRVDEDYQTDPRRIPTAFRHSFRQLSDLLPRLADQHVVVYCHRGKKISTGAAALLQSHGISAEALAGGHVAWREAGLPLISLSKQPALQSGGSVWVTRHRPKVDRIACPWMIKRFVDPRARFLFVPPGDVVEVADKYDAIAFDVPGVFWTHRGDRCTFDTMLDEFSLQVDALHQLAAIVRAADTDDLQSAPQAAGLLAASLGLSRMYRDDQHQLDAGMQLYDAFYRWCRDASNEGHVWIEDEVAGNLNNE